MKNLFAFVVHVVACSVLATSAARVDEKIYKNLAEAETTNVKVTFRKANVEAAFQHFKSLNLTSRVHKLNRQYAILKDHADIVQADVTSILENTARNGKKHNIAQLWISNELIVRNVDKEMVAILRDHRDVESLEAEWFIQLDDDMEERYDVPRNDPSCPNEWGVVNVGAPMVWATGNVGEGAVVGVIDTGVRATHVALRKSYRGNNAGESHNYNWFAPNGRAAAPSDDDGHGTHVTGTASGTVGIGVAPGSRWIACQGCNYWCSNFDLSECGNWMACPTKIDGTDADCSKAPNVVNNSWGGPSYDAWYDKILTVWTNGGIVPIFAAGNSGPQCQSLVSPADRPLAIGIASIGNDNKRSSFSSNGPTADGRRNPFIGAPGSHITSASHYDDKIFRTLSGTSMSAPHASGVVALLFGQNPDLTVPQVIEALSVGAIAHTADGAECGGIMDDEYPNNHIGFGRIWAPAAIEYISAKR